MTGISIGGPDQRAIIQGNSIGTNALGDRAVPNATGVMLSVLQGGLVEIGGSGDFEGNLISGNYHAGIWCDSIFSGLHSIRGNLIGTDATGQKPLGNGSFGIISWGSSLVAWTLRMET
jgi:hypothetical protein